MKLIAIAALLASVEAMSAHSNNFNQEKLYHLMRLQECPEVLENTEEELHYQLGEFSRTLEKKNWDNAMTILTALKGSGKTPKYAVTTKELYDHSFSFPKVRNYDYAMEQMSDLENVEDNLNKNITNDYHL